MALPGMTKAKVFVPATTLLVAKMFSPTSVQSPSALKSIQTERKPAAEQITSKVADPPM